MYAVMEQSSQSVEEPFGVQSFLLASPPTLYSYIQQYDSPHIWFSGTYDDDDTPPRGDREARAAWCATSAPQGRGQSGAQQQRRESGCKIFFVVGEKHKDGAIKRAKANSTAVW